MSDIGPCKRCGSPGHIHAYWGPVLCAPCVQYLVPELNARDKWPAVPWNEDDMELIK